MLSLIISCIFALMQFHFTLWFIAHSCLTRRQQRSGMLEDSGELASLTPTQTLPHPCLCPHLTPECAHLLI